MRSARINFTQVFRINERDIQRTSNGFLKLPVRVSRIGTMVYKDRRGDEYNEFKPPEELFNKDTMESLRDVPVTNKHPREIFVRPYNCKRLSVGHVCSEKPEPDEARFLKTNLVITDQDIIDSVYRKFQNGEDQQVSAGYSAVIVNEKGDWNGEPYDSIQREIQFNHCALVDIGRAGEDVKLLWPREEIKSNESPVLNSEEFSDFKYSSVFI